MKEIKVGDRVVFVKSFRKLKGKVVDTSINREGKWHSVKSNDLSFNVHESEIIEVIK